LILVTPVAFEPSGIFSKKKTSIWITKIQNGRVISLLMLNFAIVQNLDKGF